MTTEPPLPRGGAAAGAGPDPTASPTGPVAPAGPPDPAAPTAPASTAPAPTTAAPAGHPTDRHAPAGGHGGRAGSQHAGHGHAGHAHAVTPGADRRYLRVALGLLTAFLLGEVVVATAVHSLALLSDAGHMLTDVAALAASLYALRLADRPAAGAWTFGWQRAETLSAAGNGATLLVVAVLVAVEAARRLVHPPPVGGAAVVGTALAGLAVNAAALAALSRAQRGSLGLAGVVAHLLTDAYGFAGTAVAGVVVLTTGYRRADPLASLVVVALMVRAGVPLLRESGRVLLQAAPAGIDLDDVRAHLLAQPHVHDVHDLHVWTVSSALPTVSVHVVLDDACFTDGHAPQLLDSLQGCLAGHFDVQHSTFQLEPAGHGAHEAGAHH